MIFFAFISLIGYLKKKNIPLVKDTLFLFIGSGKGTCLPCVTVERTRKKTRELENAWTCSP